MYPVFDPAKAVFVVYHVGSTMEQAAYYKGSFGARKSAAKRKAAALNAKALAEAEKAMSRYPDNEYNIAALEQAKAGAYAVAERMEYNNEVVYWVQAINMMSNKPYWERSNTPGYCSPSSEAYWSM